MSNLIISNFQAINAGDGKNVTLSWAVPDLSQVKYFIVEIWDNSKKAWVPHDGFHGTLFPRTGDQYPPRRVTVSVPRPGNVLFRVRAVSHQGESSDWSNIACDVVVEGSQYAETSYYFIKSGFAVTHSFGFNINVESGVAYLGGSRVFVPSDVSIRLPDQVNVQYIIYITSRGIINFTQENRTPDNSIQLALVTVGASGQVTIVDRRFLWAPENLNVLYDPDLGRLCYFLTWDLYNELNLKCWRIYRAEGITEPDPEEFRAIATVEKDVDLYEDVYNLRLGVRYWYKIAAIDWGDNESQLSAAFSLDLNESDLKKPSKPTGLVAEAVGSGSVINIDLAWNANPETGIIGYNIWYRTDNQENYVRLGSVGGNITTYTHMFARKGTKYWYCVSAYNKFRVESDRSEPVSCEAGDTMPPAAPTWGYTPLTTGAIDDGPHSCWVALEWHEVQTDQDGTPVKDLTHYNIYTINEGIRRLVTSVPAGSNSYRLEGLTRKARYTFIVTAVDKWGNESDPSEERSITAGGPTPKPPVLLSVDHLDNPKVKVVFTSVHENTEESGGGPATVTEYVVYRAINAPLNFIEVGRVKALDPQPDEYTFIDSTAVRGDQYYYCVRATNASFNYSDYSNYMGIKAGDYTPPVPPTWVSVETQINSDYTIDNILTFNCGQEADLHGIYIYSRRAGSTENWNMISIAPAQEENPYVFVHHDLINKETYQYRLVAYDLVGNLSFSSDIESIVAGNLYPPKAPIVTAEGGYDYELNQAFVSLTWPEVTENDNPNGQEPVVGLIGYRVYRSQSKDYNYKLIDTIPNNETNTLLDLGLNNGGKYYYRITAYNVFGQESEPYQVEAIAGDTTPPLMPEVALTPIFNAASASLVTVELHITSEDNPGYYKIYRSINGVQWFLDGTIPRNADGETIYTYEMAYGNTAYCRVSAVSVPGVEGPYYELERQVLDTVAPGNIPAPAVTFEQTADGNFTAVVSWSYSPPKDFSRYEILFDQNNPAVVATITDKDVKIYRVNGLKPGMDYSFAVVCVDVYGLRSMPVWKVATPVDSTIPKAPASVRATSGILLILVEWDPVTENTNGTICNDLGYYVIQAARNEEFDDATEIIAPGTSTTYTFNTSDTSSTWYFRVKARDWYSNESEWTVSNGARASTVNEQIGDEPPSDAPTWADVQPTPATGIEWARDNAGNPIENMPENVWIRFAWNPVNKANHYNVYLSTDGSSYYLVGQPRSTEYRVDGLLTNTTYYIKVAGAGILGGEGPSSTPRQVTTSKVIRVVPPIGDMTVTEGKGMIALRWDPCPIKDVEYVLQYRATLNPPGDIRTWEPEWTEIYRGKTTSYIHTSLEYEKFYQYRVYCVDLSGNISDYGPVDYDLFDWTPDTIGSDDLSANAIYSKHIYSDQINALHISSYAIEARHLSADSVTAGKIAAGAVTTRELSVSLGGYNSILNSAFGMTDLHENFGPDWQIVSTCQECGSSELAFNKYGEVVCLECDEVQTGFEIAKVPGLPINSEYCLYIERGAPYLPNREIVQDLEISHMSGEQSILSFYLKTDSIMGDECCVDLIIKYKDGIETKTETITFTIKNTTDWVRRKVPIEMPEEIVSAKLHIYMKNYSIGALWLTGLQLEVGDVITPWNPNQNELYGCSGLVQINTEGIKVLNGKVSIITDEGSVSITGAGILAKKDDNNYAFLNRSGLSVYSTGNEGALNIVSLNEGNSLEIRASGIKAKRQDVEVFDLDTATASLSIFGGNLKFTSDDDPSNPTYLEISSAGVTAKKNGTTTLRFDNTISKLSIFDGSFELRTSAEGLAQGLVFTKDGIKAYSTTKVTFELNAATGDVKIRNGILVLGEQDESGARLVLDPDGLRLYSESSISNETGLVFRLSREPIDDVLLFIDGSQGSFKISAGSDSVIFTEDGMVGPNFQLDKDGLIIRDGVIKNGDVTIDSNGMSIFGGYGLRIYSKEPTHADAVLISTIDDQGITIRGERGLKIIGDGEIVFEDPDAPGGYATAIRNTGINASAVTAGVLKITGAQGDDNPRIEVYDGDAQKVAVDRRGINIYDGSLNVYSSDGATATIRDGIVLADGLQIGIGASNFIRNGRGDFGLEFWRATGNLSIASMINERGVPAGRTGKYAFRLETHTGGGRLEQEKPANDDYAEKKDTIYTFTAWTYLVNGKITVEVAQGDTILNGNDGSTPKETTITKSGWTRTEIRFIPTELTDGVVTPVTYRFLAEGSTIAYITDVCCVEGDYSATYTCHPTEISSAGGSVQITDQGIAVKNGLFSLKSSEDGTSFEITGKGIYQYKSEVGDKENNYIFKLDSDGFGLKLQSSNIVINDTDGIKIADSANADKFVQLTTTGPQKGLIIRGGLIDISSGGESGDRLSIKDNRISVYSNNEEIIGMGLVQDNENNSTYGLVIRNGAIDISSGSLNQAGLRIKGDQISVRDELGNDIIQLGYVDMDDINLYGLMIKDGRFSLSSSGGNGYIDIDNTSIKVTHEFMSETGDIVRSYTELTYDGLYSYTEGPNGEKLNRSDYISRVQASEEPVPIGQTVRLYGFTRTPKIFVSPASFMTYCSKSPYAGRTQSIRFMATDVSAVSFVPTATYLVDSVLMTTMTKSLPSSKVGARDSWQEWTVATSSTSATQLTVKVYYYIASEGSYHRATTMRYAVDFSYDGGSTWSQAVYKSRSGGQSGTETYISQVTSPRRIYARIRATYEDPSGGHPAYIQMTSASYYADESIPVGGDVPIPYVNYIAIE